MAAVVAGMANQELSPFVRDMATSYLVAAGKVPAAELLKLILQTPERQGAHTALARLPARPDGDPARRAALRHVLWSGPVGMAARVLRYHLRQKRPLLELDPTVIRRVLFRNHPNWCLLVRCVRDFRVRGAVPVLDEYARDLFQPGGRRRYVTEVLFPAGRRRRYVAEVL